MTIESLKTIIDDWCHEFKIHPDDLVQLFHQIDSTPEYWDNPVVNSLIKACEL